MPLRKCIQVDGTMNCRIRTTSTRVTARGNDPPQRIPEVSMRGRRRVLVINFGAFGEEPGTNVRVVIGGAEVAWPTSTLPINGFGMDIYESVELDIDEQVLLFALLDPTGSPHLDADLRIMELA